MPDCESIRKRRKSTIVALDRMALPRRRSGLFDLSLFDRQRRARHEVDLLLEQHVQQERDRVGRIRAVAVHGDDDVAARVREAGLVGAPVALAALEDRPARPARVATSAVRSVEALSTTTTSSTIGGICSMTARTPSSSLWHGMTTEMRLPRYMGSSRESGRRDQAVAVVLAPVPHVASVARAGCLPVSLRHALRSLRLDHSFRTAGIMRGLKRMLMVRKHS